jgi:mRNA interferase ChpB
MKPKYPERGDIIHLDFDPTRGSEQQGKRLGLVLTKSAFNRFGLAMVAPITQGGGFARHNGFTVSLAATGLDAQGVVLCNQARMLDFAERSSKIIERASDEVVDDVLARVRALLD